MPSFDAMSDLDWQEVDNAVNQATKEITTRFDFKGVKSELKVDRKAAEITLWVSVEEKLDSLNDVLQNKLIKRGISLLSLDYQPVEPAFGGSVRRKIKVQAGISTEKAKEIIKFIKQKNFKVQAQIQDEKVRVSGKNRDDLQTVIGALKAEQNSLKISLQFGNFRD